MQAEGHYRYAGPPCWAKPDVTCLRQFFVRIGTSRPYLIYLFLRRNGSVRGLLNIVSGWAEMLGCMALVALIMTHLMQARAKPDDAVMERKDAQSQFGHSPFVKVFRGPHVPKKLSEITISNPLEWKQTKERIGVVATGTKIRDILSGALTLEWESLYAQHWGTSEFRELGGAIYARWNRFPWNNYIKTSLSVGIGPSITDKAAYYEPHNGTRSRGLLQLNFEIYLYSPADPRWALLFRIQHRSGVFKLINSVRGGSNFLTIGIRRQFYH